MLPEVDVDVVVALHDLRRPVHRAVASVLHGADLRGVVGERHRVRVTVACHELDADAVRHTVEQRLDEVDLTDLGAHVRYLEVRDGLGSPSGPFNAGLAAATGRYVAIVGSDDWLAPGAVAAWTSRADQLGSDWLISRLETQDGEHIATPRARPGRTGDLDFVKDRLAYRTAPLGLLRRDTLVRLGLLDDGTPATRHDGPSGLSIRTVRSGTTDRPVAEEGGARGPLTPGMRTGGDIALTLRLATTPGVRVDYAVDLPPYVIGTSGGDRITEAVRPITTELTAHQHLVGEPWVQALPADARRSLAVKMLRIHALGAVRRRTDPLAWAPGEAGTVQTLVQQLLALAPGAERALHRADRALVADILAARDVDDLAAASARRAAAGRLDILLTPGPVDNLDPESTLRAHLRTALDDLRARRRDAAARRTSARRPPTHPVHPDHAFDGGDLHDLRVLVLAFSPIASDARVLRQVRHLGAAGARVVTCGYGPAPEGVVAHVQVPDDVTNRLDGRLVTSRVYRAVYWAQDAVRWVRRELPAGAADVVLANDTDTLPLALSLRPRLGVHADLHEYWPRWREEHPSWLARIGPYQEWICRRHLPRAGAVTTVSERIAAEYAELFGVEVGVVTNAAPLAELDPSPTHSPLRLVHSGAGLRSRAIHVMAHGALAAARDGADITLDLYLTPNDPAYLAELRELAATCEGVLRVHDPVPYADLVATLARHDVGIFVLPPVNFNYANALPNKIFDFVQARLGVVVGPSPDMARLVRERGLGLVADGFTAEDVRRAVLAATALDVDAWKAAAHAAAHELSDVEQSRRWVESVARIAATPGGSRHDA